MKFFRVKPAKERKVVFLRKRWLAIPGALLCICALCLVTALPSYVSASTTERQLPIYCVQRDYKTCALSFDAAWGNEDTQTLIDTFDKSPSLWWGSGWISTPSPSRPWRMPATR